MPNITPAARVTSTTTPGAAKEATRFFGRFDGPLNVTMDATGSGGSFVGEVALDAFKPPLSREKLEGRAMRVSLPPNAAGTLPVELVEKNGRAFLRVAADKATVSMLMSSPMAIAIGKAELLGQADGAVSAPEMVLQLNADTLRIDRSAPTLRMELDARAQDVRAVEFAKNDVAGLRDGSSSWFGGRQLQDEHAGLAARAAETNAAVTAMRADLEGRFNVAEPVFRLLSMPQEVAPRAGFQAAHNAAIEAKEALVVARELRQSFVELGLDAELPEQDEKIAGLEAIVAAGVKAEADVRGLFEAARRNQPAQADAWLATLGQLQRAPDFNVTLAAAARANDALALNEADAARVAANNAKNLPEALTNAEVLLTRMTKQLESRDARIAGLRDGTGREIVETAPTHAADMKVI